MRKILFTFVILLMVVAAAGCEGSSDKAEAPAPKATEAPAKSDAADKKEAEDIGGCAPKYRALYDEAVIELPGEGELEIVIITDPLCWHCRLAHKLLGEYPNLYSKVRLLFFPRKSYIGSDMAAWILEDAVGTDRLQEMVDFAYTDLKKAKTKDLIEARMLMLYQFTQAFPEMLEGTNLDELYEQIQLKNEFHVMKTAQLGRKAEIPGTPVLIAGKRVIVGFGPDQWIKALEEQGICE